MDRRPPVWATRVRAGRRRVARRDAPDLLLELGRRIEAVPAHARDDLRVDRLDHLHTRVALGVGLDEVPRRPLSARALEHLLDRPGVGLTALAVAPVLVGQLPRLQRVALTALEAAQLLG